MNRCLLFAALIAVCLSSVAAQEIPGQGEPDDDVRPSPPSIGADVPVTYFGPAPSSVQRELIGPLQLLTSGTVDTEAGTTTIPLYYGYAVNSRTQCNEHDRIPNSLIWYILTDTTDEQAAQALGLNLSSKIRFANVGNGARWASMGRGNKATFLRSSFVDFRPIHRLMGRNPTSDNTNVFPPVVAQPGSVGAINYSPIAFFENLGHMYNAPVVADYRATEEQLNAYCDGLPPVGTPEYAFARTLVHDKVVAICPREQTVTLRLTPGFSFARPVLYLSTDANTATAAALEQATQAPGLNDVELGDDDSFGSAVERLFAVVNGYNNAEDLPSNSPLTNHPGRSGFNSALRGEGSPLNVLGGIPTIATDYSPLWDVNIGMWTPEAVAAGFRTRWLEEFQILGFVERGLVTGPGGAPFGSTGNLVNCPIIQRFL